MTVLGAEHDIPAGYLFRFPPDLDEAGLNSNKSLFVHIYNKDVYALSSLCCTNNTNENVGGEIRSDSKTDAATIEKTK